MVNLFHRDSPFVNLWHRLVASCYDRALAPFEERWLRQKRCELLQWCQGQVLEIGGGTGANLECYAESGRLIFSDPDSAMLAKSLPRLNRGRLAVQPLQCRAEDLPFKSQTFDTVVATLVLCSVCNLDGVLRDVARVLRRGGRFLFIEHVRAEGKVARWQDRLTPIWSRLALGCHLNRNTVSHIQNAGFHLARLERHHPPGMPRLAQPVYSGVALNRASHSLRKEEFERFDNIGAQGGHR
ncbi:MAG: class I SAM-dependent methyltransferase [Acidobacteria bacterium]|nr:MAG: class I SAM-dependent methyltransferase [Acidobacteriota bacterium]